MDLNTHAQRERERESERNLFCIHAGPQPALLPPTQRLRGVHDSTVDVSATTVRRVLGPAVLSLPSNALCRVARGVRTGRVDRQGTSCPGDGARVLLSSTPVHAMHRTPHSLPSSTNSIFMLPQIREAGERRPNDAYTRTFLRRYIAHLEERDIVGCCRVASMSSS